jgi:hypothetical protein
VRRVQDTKKVDKAQTRMIQGVWVGRSMIDDAHIYLTASGLKKARTVVRNIESETWQHELFKSIKGTPWNPLAIPGKVTIPKSFSGAHMRNQYITSKMIKDFGESDGCPRCKGGTGPHSEFCRQRFTKLCPTAGQEEDTGQNQNPNAAAAAEGSAAAQRTWPGSAQQPGGEPGDRARKSR